MTGPARFHRWNKVPERQTVSLISRGLNDQRVAERLGCNAESVRRIRHRNGFAPHHYGADPVNRFQNPGKPELLAYLAGLIDGEGSIVMMKFKEGRRPIGGSTARISVTNTDLPLMKWLVLTFGGQYHLTGDWRKFGGTKPCYHWGLDGSATAVACLTAVLPYLRIKRANAVHALKLSRWRLKQREVRSMRRRKLLKQFDAEN
jgi:hypothetical protein